MGSRSTCIKAKIGGLEGRKLKDGDRIGHRNPGAVPKNLAGRRCAPEDFSPPCKTLRVLMGPQDDYFTQKGVETFLSGGYTVTDRSDRMGCRLEGPAVEHVRDGNILSDGIAFGAVQIPSEGKPIVMLADRQTTGGYAKIANVIMVDLPLIAQSKTGDQIRFEKVDIAAAQDLYLAERAAFDALAGRLDAGEVLPESVTARVAEKPEAKTAAAQNSAAPRIYAVEVNGRSFRVLVSRAE
jgi:biotin-dependent carboxylase-like uncharacterized protein